MYCTSTHVDDPMSSFAMTCAMNRSSPSRRCSFIRSLHVPQRQLILCNFARKASYKQQNPNTLYRHFLSKVNPHCTRIKTHSCLIHLKFESARIVLQEKRNVTHFPKQYPKLRLKKQNNPLCVPYIKRRYIPEHWAPQSIRLFRRERWERKPPIALVQLLVKLDEFTEPACASKGVVDKDLIHRVWLWQSFVLEPLDANSVARRSRALGTRRNDSFRSVFDALQTCSLFLINTDYFHQQSVSSFDNQVDNLLMAFPLYVCSIYEQHAVVLAQTPIEPSGQTQKMARSWM